MKTKVFILSAGIFLLIALPIQMTAQYQQAMQRDTYHDCIIQDLTENQQEKIDAIKVGSYKTTALLRADIDIKEAELDKLLLEDEPSKTKINSKIDEISVLRANIQKENMSKRIDIRNELTPEQKNIFDVHRGHRGHAMHNNKGNQMHNNSNCIHNNGEGRHNNGEGRHMRMDYHNK